MELGHSVHGRVERADDGVVPGNGRGEEERRQGAAVHRLQPFSRLEYVEGLEVQKNCCLLYFCYENRAEATHLRKQNVTSIFSS